MVCQVKVKQKPGHGLCHRCENPLYTFSLGLAWTMSVAKRYGRQTGGQVIDEIMNGCGQVVREDNPEDKTSATRILFNKDVTDNGRLSLPRCRDPSQ